MDTEQRDAATATAAGVDAEAYWTTVARVANLARHLTTLADRYERAAAADGARAAERRDAVARMRATAAAGARLLRSLVPPDERTASAPRGMPRQGSQRR